MSHQGYQRIIAHASYDGALAAGILAHVYDLPIEFAEVITGASDSIVLGVPLGPTLGLSSCLVFTNFACRAVTAQVGFGNVVVCEEGVSLSRLVADVVEVDVPEDLLDLADRAEELDLTDETLVPIALSLSPDIGVLRRIAELAKGSSWDGVREELRRWGASIDVSKHLQQAREIASKRVSELGKIGLVSYAVESNALPEKLACVILAERYKHALALGMREHTVFEGFFLSLIHI